MTTILPIPDQRARLLTKALGGRVAKGRLFLPGCKAAQFELLYAAGFHARQRRGAVVFRRDPMPLGLYDALEAARAVKLQNCGLTANDKPADPIPNLD